MRLTTLLDTVNQGGSGPWPLTDSTSATDDRQTFDQLVADFIPCRAGDPELWFAERTARGRAGQGAVPRVPADRRMPGRRHRACRAVGRLGRRGVRRRRGGRDQAWSRSSAQERGTGGLRPTVTRPGERPPATPGGRCTRTRGAPPTRVCAARRPAATTSYVTPGPRPTSPSRWASTAAAPIPAQTAAVTAGSPGVAPVRSWAARVGQASSASVRCRSRQRRQAPAARHDERADDRVRLPDDDREVRGAPGDQRGTARRVGHPVLHQHHEVRPTVRRRRHVRRDVPQQSRRDLLARRPGVGPPVPAAADVGRTHGTLVVEQEGADARGREPDGDAQPGRARARGRRPPGPLAPGPARRRPRRRAAGTRPPRRPTPDPAGPPRAAVGP